MFLYSEEDNQEERKKNQIEETERKKLTCSECGREFQDMRGLTSHARHMHDIGKEELINTIQQKNAPTNWTWKILGGIGAIIVTVITLGNSQ